MGTAADRRQTPATAGVRVVLHLPSACSEAAEGIGLQRRAYGVAFLFCFLKDTSRVGHCPGRRSVSVCVFTSPNNGPQPFEVRDMGNKGKCLKAKLLSAFFRRSTYCQITWFMFYIISLTVVYLSLLDCKIAEGRGFFAHLVH